MAGSIAVLWTADGPLIELSDNFITDILPQIDRQKYKLHFHREISIASIASEEMIW